MVRARRLGASPADIGEALGITRQAVYNRLHALERRAETDPDFVIPDLEETEKIPDLDTTPHRKPVTVPGSSRGARDEPPVTSPPRRARA